MKNGIKLYAISLILLLALFICSCFDRSSGTMQSPSYGFDGEYIGFSDIPVEYNADSAIDDGCLVIDTVSSGTNAYGTTHRETRTAAGYDKWSAFLDAANSGKDAFLRVVHFIDGAGYYHDLYFHDGKYTIFEYNEYGISGGESYLYLRRLDGYVGAAGEKKENSIYVLTDSMELTYDDVYRNILSSSISPVIDTPYTMLWFMSYFD